MARYKVTLTDEEREGLEKLIQKGVRVIGSYDRIKAAYGASHNTLTKPINNGCQRFRRCTLRRSNAQ